ncbi:MAG: rhomboid family intramembrane serine protease [Bacteroidetes bacterium]|nr:rhomboid family intramembrane serine protease [Bacteroidota bacterium]
MNIIDEIKESFKQGTTLHKLIYLNLGVFLAVQLVRIALLLSNNQDLYDTFLTYLAVPSNPEVLIRRPWTIITYMFLHEGFIHILFNLLWLYWFGTLFVQELGLKKLLSTYLLGGISGGLLFVLFYNLFPVFDQVSENAITLGASASVMAVIVAAAAYRPDRKMHLVLIGPVKVGYIALAMFIVSSLIEFSNNTGGKIAHIGGALTGFLFAYYYKQGKDITRGFDRMMDRIATWFQPGKQRMKVTHKRPVDDIEYNKHKSEEQKEVDIILDKISKGGYDNLTSKEKELLFKMSDKK